MNYEKLKKVCSPIRIVVGIVLIVIAVLTGINWFYLGVIPLIVGITNFCPLCVIRKQCEVNLEEKK